MGIAPSELEMKTDDENLSGFKRRREDRAELSSTKAHQSDMGAHARTSRSTSRQRITRREHIGSRTSALAGK